MNITTPQLDFSKYTAELNLMVSISSRLADSTKFAALCIKTAIKSDMPCKVIIATIKDRIQDNEPVIVEMMGVELTNRIKNYEI